MALRSARARGRAGFFFKLVLAPVARGGFSFSVKWLALRAGQRQGGVFRIPPPYLWTPLSPQRVKGFSPLTIPKMKSKPKNASRFAKRIFLCFSHLRLRRRFHLSAGRYRQQRRNTRCGSSKSEKREKSATATTAASGGNREELLGQRPAGCERQRSRRWEPQPVLAQRLAFFRFDNSSGIIKGEQPLIRASRASKVAGAFLVLFWHAKENLAPRKSALARATSAKSISKTISGSLLARKREPYSAFFKNSGNSFSISASAFPR